MSLFWPKAGGGCCCGEPGCAGSIKVTVRKCTDNTTVSGASVTITDSASSVVGFATSDGSGVAEIPITEAGDYTITVTATGFAAATVPVAATCATNNVTVKLGGTMSFLIHGCGCALPGALCTMTQTVGGTYSASALTDSAGAATLYLPSLNGATFLCTVSAPLYQTYTQTIGPLGPTSCNLTIGAALPFFAPRILATEPEYYCYGGDPPYCRDVIPPTLELTIVGGVHGGTHTLTYEGQTGLGYVWAICLPGGTGTDQSTRYEHYAANGYFGGASGPGFPGCNTPGGKFVITGFNHADCTDIASTVSIDMTAGTAACPVAASFTPTFTVSE